MQNNNEVDLVDFFKTIKNNKRAVILFVLLGLLLACLYIFMFQKSIVESVVEIGGNTKDPIESANQLVSKINMGVYGNFPGLLSNSYLETNLVKITISSKDKDTAVKNLRKVTDLILSEQNKNIEDITKSAQDKQDTMLNILKYSNSQVLLLQNDLSYTGGFRKTKIIKDVEVLPPEGYSKTITKIILSGIVGFVISLLWIFSKNWYKRAISNMEGN